MIFDFLPLKQVFILIDVSNCLALEKTAVVLDKKLVCWI